MLSIICFIWQLPQNLLALIIQLFSSDIEYKVGMEGVAYNILHKSILPHDSSISLGNYILTRDDIDISIRLHEKGHQIQSLYFGPLYLIFIGIPSILRLLHAKLVHKSYAWYHSGYPEDWADNLGGRWYKNAKKR